MLQTYPDNLLAFAVDGVIHASSLQRAGRLAKIEDHARGQIAREREQARAEADELRASAAFDGYRDGLLLALNALQPVLDGLRQEQVALAGAVRDHVHQTLQRMSTDPDVVVEPICAALRQRLDPRGEATRAVLHIPQEQDALMQALQADPRTQHIDLRPTGRRHLLLEVGPLAWELDLRSALAEDIEAALAQALPGVQHALSRLADRYGTTLREALDAATRSRRLRRTEEAP